MNDNICPYTNGAKCAGDYCDFWDPEEQICSKARESKLRCEMMVLVLEKLSELLEKAQDKEDVKKLIQELNIVNVGGTRH